MAFTVAMSEIVDIFAENIKYYRIKNNLSQEQLAELAGIHRTNISAIERGKRNVTLLLIERLATALGVNAFLLLTPRKNVD